MAEQQQSSQAIRYAKGEDSSRIAAESTAKEVHQWAEEWHSLLTRLTLDNYSQSGTVERFILCSHRLAAVAQLQKCDPTPLLTFITNGATASSLGIGRVAWQSHLGEALGVVECVDSWAKGQVTKQQVAGIGTEGNGNTDWAPPPAAKPEHGEGKGGAGLTPGQPAVMSPAERKAAFEKLEPAVRNAYLAFQFVATRLERPPKLLEVHVAYEWLKEHGIDQDKGDLGELTDYKLPPSSESFQRYLSEALNALGENKYTRRAERPTGRSIVLGSAIEQQHTNDG